MEEGVEEENLVRLDRVRIEEHGCGRSLEGVANKRGLDHHQRVRCRLTEQHDPVVRALVWARIKNLQKLRAAEMEHELRVSADPGNGKGRGAET